MKNIFLYFLFSFVCVAQTEPILWQKQITIDSDFSGDSLKVFEIPPRWLPEKIQIKMHNCSGFDSLYVGIRGDERGGTKPHRFAPIWVGKQANDSLTAVFRNPSYYLESSWGKMWTYQGGINVPVDGTSWAATTGFENHEDSVLVSSGDSIQIPLYGNGVWNIGYGVSFASSIGNIDAYTALFAGGYARNELWARRVVESADIFDDAGRQNSYLQLEGGDFISLRMSASLPSEFSVEQGFVVVSLYSVADIIFDRQRDLCLYLIGNTGLAEGEIIITME